ncbi:hypothetical protein CTAYLR_009802 [Chrysophaeum taylorii]|uniref:FYVE-type domain-containing protein n=1 Tax=Chrysophaeum taylorii TaxID=2483200 RepID=A0AAD7XR77_9STRA|nr:hypothetical protein CTAYLR_009802 [Chrysophaeum taylorii]
MAAGPEEERRPSSPTRAEVAAAYMSRHKEKDELDELIEAAILGSAGSDVRRLGLEVTPGPRDVSEIEVLVARLAAGHQEPVDLLETPRTLVRAGKVSAGEWRTSRREAYLLNDCLLLCEQKQAALVLRTRIDLASVARVKRTKKGFELDSGGQRGGRKVYSDEDFATAVGSAVVAIKRDQGLVGDVGWQHAVLTGTAWACALGFDASEWPSVGLDDLDEEGFAPLHLAAYHGKVKGVRELLRRGAAPGIPCTAPDFAGATPLHLAARRCDEAVVVALLEAGAPADAVDARRFTPFSACASSRACEDAPGASRRVLAALPRTDAALYAAANAGLTETTRHLVVHLRLDPNARVDGATPLHAAAERGFADILEVLLEAGARPNARDANGATPLDVAGAEDAASVLRAHGARRTTGAAAPEWETKELTAGWRPRVALSKNGWTPDAARTTCALCDDLFTNVKRRHHCRKCGCLCCGACSTKTVSLLDGLEADSPDHKRVCDACFNKLYRSSASVVSEAVADLGDQLRQRGEALERVAEGADHLEHAAANYRDNAKRLRQHLERKRAFF